ncbi:MAG: phosphotransferase [Opitutus sp.]
MLRIPSPEPSAGRVIATLKEGYWDRTTVVELPDGSSRVRKSNNAAAAAQPWGVESLRREICYLTTLPPHAAAVLPPVLACWDRQRNGGPDLGYETPFYSRHRDAGAFAQSGELVQSEIDEFQEALAHAVLDRLHDPLTAPALLSEHIVTTMREGLKRLSQDELPLVPLIDAPAIALNGRPALGPRAALEQVVSATDVLAVIDAAPSVRLHGDLFLENILWRSATVPSDEPRLILIDPVSVAGISCGPPIFDLVKYQSYATGELLGLRTARVEVSGIGGATHEYRWRIRTEDAALQPFRQRDWYRKFRRAFEVRHGAPDARLGHLIDAYFSVAMAVNTTGLQRQARLLKATSELNALLGPR